MLLRLQLIPQSFKVLLLLLVGVEVDQPSYTDECVQVGGVDVVSHALLLKESVLNASLVLVSK